MRGEDFAVKTHLFPFLLKQKCGCPCTTINLTGVSLGLRRGLDKNKTLFCGSLEVSLLLKLPGQVPRPWEDQVHVKGF